MDEQKERWFLSQLEKLIRIRPDWIGSIFEKLMREDEHLRWAIIVGAYLDGEINLGKAAELLKMHRLELQQKFIQKGIPLRLGPETVEEAKAEVETWVTWKRQE